MDKETYISRFGIRFFEVWQDIKSLKFQINQMYLHTEKNYQQKS